MKHPLTIPTHLIKKAKEVKIHKRFNQIKELQMLIK